MQLQEIVIDQALRELTPRGTPAFPLEMYCNDISEFITHYVPWHWHREIEFGYVLNGNMVIEYTGHKVNLSPGDGFFINSNELHAMRPLNDGSCETVNIVFSAEVIAGAPHSIYENKYVLPLMANREVAVVPLFQTEAWQKSLLSLLKKAFLDYTGAGCGYELLTRNHLSSAWLLLFEKSGHPALADRRAHNIHMKKALTFIHKNYMQPVSLKDIAQSANMSARSCCRYFQKQLGMTPFAYLLEYRIKIAAELLLNTDKPVTEICFETGFHDASYFTKTFRELTGYTPTSFRRNKSGL